MVETFGIKAIALSSGDGATNLEAPDQAIAYELLQKALANLAD